MKNIVFISLRDLSVWLGVAASLALAGCLSGRDPTTVYSPAPATTVVGPTSDRPAERIYSEPPIYAPAPSRSPAVTMPLGPSLGESIREAIESDPELDAKTRNVTIAVHEGRLVLHGTVASEHDRQEIHDRVERLPGVKSVDNRLQVDLR